MTTTPKIPRGWRRLRTGSTQLKGDREWDAQNNRWANLTWDSCWPVEKHETIIRRVRKKK